MRSASSSATVSAEGAQVNGPPSPATVSAEGAQVNGRPSSVGTLVRVLEPPVKDGVNPVRMRSGFMSWSTGHGLVTMLELHALSVRQSACVEHKGLCMRRWHEELLMWKRNRSSEWCASRCCATYASRPAASSLVDWITLHLNAWCEIA
jgi:hypothetical protein